MPGNESVSTVTEAGLQFPREKVQKFGERDYQGVCNGSGHLDYNDGVMYYHILELIKL